MLARKQELGVALRRAPQAERTLAKWPGSECNSRARGRVAPIGRCCMNHKPFLGLRQYSRIPFHADVLLHVDAGTIKVHLVDIALKGALVRTDTPVTLALNKPCRLVLPLADSGEGVVMTGRIVHLDQSHIGIACENMDLTSLTRLRRLIELNTGDTELMDRELTHLFG